MSSRVRGEKKKTKTKTTTFPKHQKSLSKTVRDVIALAIISRQARTSHGKRMQVVQAVTPSTPTQDSPKRSLTVAVRSLVPQSQPIL